MLIMAKAKRTNPPKKSSETKQGRGRPPSSLAVRFQVRCSKDDLARWELIAARKGLTVGTWLRMCARDEEERDRARLTAIENGLASAV